MHTGKTELALDIVREAEERCVKVFCVDFTGEYRERLADLHPIFPGPTEQDAQDLATKLFDAETGEFGAKKEKRILDESLQKMRAGIQSQVDKYLESDETDLAIFELGEIANSKATLRLTELYLSAIMSWGRHDPLTTRAGTSSGVPVFLCEPRCVRTDFFRNRFSNFFGSVALF